MMHTNRVDISQMPLHKGLEHGITGDLGPLHSKEYKGFKEALLLHHGFDYDRPKNADSLDIAAQVLFLMGLGWSLSDNSIDQNTACFKGEFAEFLCSPINENTPEEVVLNSVLYLSMPIAAATVAERLHPAPYALEYFKVALCTAYLSKKIGLQFEILATRIADYALETVIGNADILRFLHEKILFKKSFSEYEAKEAKALIYLPSRLSVLQKLQ